MRMHAPLAGRSSARVCDGKLSDSSTANLLWLRHCLVFRVRDLSFCTTYTVLACMCTLLIASYIRHRLAFSLLSLPLVDVNTRTDTQLLLIILRLFSSVGIHACLLVTQYAVLSYSNKTYAYQSTPPSATTSTSNAAVQPRGPRRPSISIKRIRDTGAAEVSLWAQARAEALASTS